MAFAKAFRARCADVESSLPDAERSMYSQVRHAGVEVPHHTSQSSHLLTQWGLAMLCSFQCLAAVSDDNASAHRDVLHPIRFAGGVMFDDGDIEVTWLSKALECVSCGCYASVLSPPVPFVAYATSRWAGTGRYGATVGVFA